jgi:hypothetical protein
MMHSRQSAIAPIIPMIQSPMQAIMPARQEKMHPISAQEKRSENGGSIGVGPSHLLYVLIRAPPHSHATSNHYELHSGHAPYKEAVPCDIQERLLSMMVGLMALVGVGLTCLICARLSHSSTRCTV